MFLWDFSTSILSQDSKKLEEGPFGEFFSKKSHSAEKNSSKVGHFSLARYCMLRGKKEKNFFDSVR